MEKKTGVARLIHAFGYSLAGLKHNFLYEASFRQEAICAIILIPIALLLPVTVGEKLMLIAAVVFVLVTELLNSAIEAVVDRIGLEYHQLSGRAKDTGSAAVLLSLLLCVGIWCAVCAPMVMRILR